jgi:hypothetical protein
MSWPSYYTYNFCPNPSAEASTAGYHPLHAVTGVSETVFQADYAQAGSYSAGVTTPGVVPGEGVSTPLGTILAATTGAVSLYAYGPAGLVLNVSAVTSDGVTRASTQVTMTGLYVQVVLDNVTMPNGLSIQALVATTEAEAVTFLVDCVQYEPESSANPYIDGDAYGGAWTGTAGLSSSYQQFQFPVFATGGLTVEGSASFIDIGEVFSIGNANPAAGPIVIIYGQLDVSGDQHPMVATTEAGRTAPTTTPPTIDTGVPGIPWEIAGGGWITSIGLYVPPGRVSDFGAWVTGSNPNLGLGDHDPAKVLLGQNNAGVSSGGTQNIGGVNTGNYSVPFAIFTPPSDQASSGAQYLWHRAAFMAAGFKVASQAAYVSAAQPGAVNFTDVQVQQAAVTPLVTPAAPTTYSYPRSLSTIVKPTRANLCPNPSFEASGGNYDEFWTMIGTATPSLSTHAYPQGSQSLLLTASAGSSGAYVTIPDLIAGDTYTASGYVVARTANIGNILMEAGSLSAAAWTGTGAMPETTSSGAMAWMQVSLTFTAPASTVQLGFVSQYASGGSGSIEFNVDCVLVEPGEVLNPYADGSNTGWEWEQGGTAALTRSYYYERQNVAAKAVTAVLDQHIPLGLMYNQPQYAVPATQ